MLWKVLANLWPAWDIIMYTTSRWDTPQHALTDDAEPDVERSEIWPGKWECLAVASFISIIPSTNQAKITATLVSAIFMICISQRMTCMIERRSRECHGECYWSVTVLSCH